MRGGRPFDMSWKCRVEPSQRGLRHPRAGGHLHLARTSAPACATTSVAFVNHLEIDHLHTDANADVASYALGALLAVGAVARWTWYPLRNVGWLRAHAARPPGTWATAQGIATLPGHLGWWAFTALRGDAFAMPFGPRPLDFVASMLVVGLLASWLSTLCWNEASQRLPTTLMGQLIVFERCRRWLMPSCCAGVCPRLRCWRASRCWWLGCCERCVCGRSRRCAWGLRPG